VKRQIVTLICLLVVGVAHLPRVVNGASLGERVEAANALYEQGNYAGAIDGYLALVSEGVQQADLFYNLGNACYKAHDLGRAVLYYERALRLEPRERDTRENLALVRTQLQDKQFIANQNRLVRGIIWFHHNLSTREMLVFMSVSYLALCIVILLIVLRETPAIGSLYGRLSIVSPGRLVGLGKTQDLMLAAGIAAVLLVTSGLSSYRKVANERNRIEAVVLEEEIPVYSSPTDDATLQFKIHRGTIVDVVERRVRWLRIRLPGGLSGWVASGAVESV
jgi:tetratricopeptide (TPR) repeat protein